MSYASRFNHDEYDVPEFLLKDENWVDVSWGNDMCPRWENYTLMLAIWVDCHDPQQRELEDHAQYTVTKLAPNGDGTYSILNDDIMGTENSQSLLEFIELYNVRHQLDIAFEMCNKLTTPCPEIADELVSILDSVNAQLGIWRP